MAAQDPQPGSPAQYEAADKMLKVCSVAQRHSAARKQRIAPGSPNCLCVSFPFPPVLVPCPKHEAPDVSDPCHTLVFPIGAPGSCHTPVGLAGKEAAFSGSHLCNLPV